LEMFTNLGYVSTKVLRGTLVVALGATLAALAAVALVVASGTAVGQQQGQEASPSQGQESSAEPGFAPKPEQSTESKTVPAERVVGLNEGVTNSTQGLEQAAEASGGRVVDRLDVPKNRAVLLKFPTEQAAQAAADGLAKRPDVQYVERNGIVEATGVSSDPQVGSQWHHTVIRKTADLGTLPSAPPTIAVVDSGVDYNHPDLRDNIWTNPGEVAGNSIDDDNNGYVDDVHGYDFVNGDGDPMDDIPNSHGTHVAGIAAATAGNRQGGEGVSPNSKILAIKVLSSGDISTYFNVAQGLAYARTANTTPETKVINTSLCADPPEETQLLADEVAAIKAAGKILVASAGNFNSSAPTNISPATNAVCSYPGSDPNTSLRVTATQENDCRVFFSNFSPASNPTFYNIAAPGDNILSTTRNGGYESKGGTSMAAPMVAGAAALVWGKTPSLTREEVVNKLVSTGEKTSCGFAAPTRRLDVRKALLGTSETAIIGQLLDPATGRAPGYSPVFGAPPPPLATAKLFSGNTLLKADATNESGFYEMTGLTAGIGMKLKATRSGYVSATLRNGISIVDGKVTGPSTDAMPQARDTGNATITIDWKTHHPRTDTDGCRDTCNGWDFNIWVTLPDGDHVTSPGGHLAVPPFVSAPFSSESGGMNPLETAIIGSQAPDGTYKISAWKWSAPEIADYSPLFKGSQASVQMYNGSARLGGGLKRVPSTCGTDQSLFGQWWYVGDLTKDGTSYTWTKQNLCTNTAP
jgi:subtilisin family serine protease